MLHADIKPLPDLDKLWNFDDPAVTEIKFRALVVDEKDSTNKDYYLQLMTQIARAQGLQLKFDDAHKTLDEVQKNIDSSTPVTEIRYLLERGRVFNSSKKGDQALPVFLKAFEIATERNQDRWAVDSAHMVAIAEPKPEKQLEWNLKAMAITEMSKDEKVRNWVGSLYNNMGWTYHDSGKLDEALEMFKKALAFREIKGEPSTIRIAKWTIARTYRSMKRFNEAFEIQMMLEKEFSHSNKPDGYVFEELGELYLLTSKPDLSKKYFELAYNVLSKDAWVIANDPKKLARLKELGDVK